MATIGGSNAIKNGLVLALDAANARSYISGSTIWRDVSGNNLTASFTSWSNIDYSGSYFTVKTAGSYMNNIQGISGSAFPQKSGSISMWINMPTYSFTNQGYFDMFDSTRNHFFIRPGLSSILQIQAQSSTDTLYQAGFGDNSLQANQWYNIVLTYTTGISNSFKYYLNGILKGSGAFASSSWTPSDQFVGYGNSTNVQSIVTGSYGPMTVHNRNLSDQEILQNYNAQKSRFGL